MSLSTLKVIHIFGVTLFIGNIIVSALWKTLADRTRDLAVIRFATRLVLLADLFFTVGGLILLLGAGHAMAPAYGGVVHTPWMLWSYILLAATGLVWAMILLPVQISQARLLKPLAAQDPIPARYWELANGWAVAGAVAMVLPLPAIYFMVAKPM